MIRLKQSWTGLKHMCVTIYLHEIELNTYRTFVLSENIFEQQIIS